MVVETLKHAARDFAAFSFGLSDPADIYEGLARSWFPAVVIRAVSPRRERFIRHVIESTPVGQLLFIHVPKNSGTSIKSVLYSVDPGHASARYYQMIVPEILNNVASMAIIRDPLDRFLSAFDFIKSRGGSHVPISRKSTRRLYGVETIDDFLNHLEGIKGRWFLTDHVARPQCWYITNANQQIVVKHLWLFSQQNENFSNFLSSYGVSDIPLINQTKRVSRELTADQLKRLKQIYLSDFVIYDKMLSGASDTDLYLSCVTDFTA